MKIDVTQILIRKAILADLMAIISLHHDDILGVNREAKITDGDIPECYINAFHQMLANSNQQVLVMELNSEIIGVLELTFIHSLTRQGGIRANVEGVRIKSNYRNQGLGGRFFKYVEEIACRNNCRLIQLTTDVNRTEAKRFYEALDFSATHVGMKKILDK